MKLRPAEFGILMLFFKLINNLALNLINGVTFISTV